MDSPRRGEFLQWIHFAESMAFSPLGILVWLTRYRGDAERYGDLIVDVQACARAGFEFVERAFDVEGYLLGADFTAADIMLGFTLVAARLFGVLDANVPKTLAYLVRLEARPAFQTAVTLT